MVERINKLIKEVQSSFGLVSGSQRLPPVAYGPSVHGVFSEAGIQVTTLWLPRRPVSSD